MDYFSNYTTTHVMTTTEKPTQDIPDYVGYICAFAAVGLYGSNFVPVKKYRTGDGIFFQWILCSGIFLSGLVLQMVTNPTLYILPMVGGVVWATGNLCVVPVIKTIGMGLGLSIWGTCALCIGWAIGRYGLFKTEKADIDHLVMNDFSVVLAFISIIILLMVKNEVSVNLEYEFLPDEESPILTKTHSVANQDQDHSINGRGQLGSYNDHFQSAQIDSEMHTSRDDVLVFKSQVTDNKSGNRGKNDSSDEEEPMIWDKFSATKKRIIGSVLSVLSGLMYGVNFTPTLYVQNNYHNASQDGLDYVFSQFCGIYLASSSFMIIYCIYKKNKPQVYPEVIVPGILSGILWAIATACWNIANSTLSQAVSFPIVATGPCGLASLFWGVLIFGEIKGTKNILILVAGFLVNLTGSVLAGLSK